MAPNLLAATFMVNERNRENAIITGIPRLDVMHSSFAGIGCAEPTNISYRYHGEYMNGTDHTFIPLTATITVHCNEYTSYNATCLKDGNSPIGRWSHEIICNSESSITDMFLFCYFW